MRTTKEHIVGYIRACGPMGLTEIQRYLRAQDPSFKNTIDYVAELHDHINDLIKTGELKIYASFATSDDIGFVVGDAVVNERDEQHITEADALRDEVARWRQEAAEQAEIAHRMSKVLGHVVEMANDAHLCGHDEWHEIVKEARAALAGEVVEEPEVSPTPSFYR